jgi:protein-S-isoprenylcysteine O-methyltransferase Ste14
LGLALFSFVSWDKRSKLEDELLRERFGCEWQRYYADVPWRFLPGIC